MTATLAPRHSSARDTLAGRVAIVTGAGRGIGRASAEALAARGATVVAATRQVAAAHELVARIGGSAIGIDVRDRGHAEQLVQHALDRHGRLDTIVANAGVGLAACVAESTPDRVIELIDVNVRAPMLLARAALPTLMEQGSGTLAFVSSIAARVPVPREAVYCATKAALEAFAAGLREEVRGSGINVCVVAPGVVDTDFFSTRGSEYDRRFPRPLPPQAVADVIVRCIETGATDAVVPRWLRVPSTVYSLAPRTFNRLSRAFA